MGQIARSGNVIEFAIPLDQLPLLKDAKEIYITAAVFANSYGGIWDPGKNNAYDPARGIYKKTSTHQTYTTYLNRHRHGKKSTEAGTAAATTINLYITAYLQSGRIVALS